MSEFEKAMIEELRAIRQLLERQNAVVVQEEVRQLFTATPEQRKEQRRDILARAKKTARG